MTPAVAASCAMLAIAGLLLIAAGLRRTPEAPPRPPGRMAARWSRVQPRQRMLLAAGLAAGAAGFLLTGWVLALVIGPAAAIGVPYLLATPGGASVAKLDALAEWTRSLSGVLTVGVGLEQAIAATHRSTPEAIRPEVDALVARLRARWPAEEALRAFADDLADPTGDLVGAALILASRRRGPGLAAVLDGLAASVAAEVRARRSIETDRAKPRATARWVTLITLGVLGLLALNGTYLEPYSTPLGQLILAMLLSAYVGALLWLRQASTGRAPSRFLMRAEAP